MSSEEITELLLKSGREGNRWENLVSNRLLNAGKALFSDDLIQDIQMAIYKDRIEIYNPGTFPEGFEPQDF